VQRLGFVGLRPVQGEYQGPQASRQAERSPPVQPGERLSAPAQQQASRTVQPEGQQFALAE
jgi:hypothetical protein